MKSHESILVFFRKLGLYNKQSTHSKSDRKFGGPNGTRSSIKSDLYGGLTPDGNAKILKAVVSPKSVLDFDVVPNAKGKLHPTQKPVDLLRYLIRTYSNTGDVVMDNTMGSGSTGVACVKLGRQFVGIEIDPTYFEIACKRIHAAEIQQTLDLAEALPAAAE